MREPLSIVRSYNENNATPLEREPNAVRRALEEAKTNASQSAWELARIITLIVDLELWRSWHYASREDWVLKDLKGIYSPTSVSRMVKAIHRLQKMSAKEREAFTAAPIWNAIEALESEKVETAVELITSGKTQAEIRDAVRIEKTADAEAHGEPAAVKEKFIDLPRVPEEVGGFLDAARNLARFHLERDTPAEIDVLRFLFGELAPAGFNAITDATHLYHKTSDGIEVTFTMVDVAAGKVRCRMCESWNWTKLTPHHVIPRSRQCKKCGTPENLAHPRLEGLHDVPLVLLCATPCHSSIKDSPEGSWRAWANKWGFGELAALHEK